MSGDNLDFGKVLVSRESALTNLGFSSSDYSISEIDTATDTYLVDIGSIDATTLLGQRRSIEAHLQLPNLSMRSTSTRLEGVPRSRCPSGLLRVE